MRISIHDDRKIYSVQEEFQKLFPYLKIEFFTKPHQVGGSSHRRLMKSPAITLGECRVVHRNGVLFITPGMTVADLEQYFRSVYGLSVQVFRKSGKAWLETSVTDGWTLDQQNREGEELSN